MFIFLRKRIFFVLILKTAVHLELDYMTEINVSSDDVIIFRGSHFHKGDVQKGQCYRAYRKLNLKHKKMPLIF